jgi:hypothetical protein
MRFFLRLTAWIHGFIAILLALSSLLLLVTALHTGWVAVAEGMDEKGALTVIEAIGLLAVAIVSLQIAQTIVEEEVIRDAHVSGPTRVRRFLSRFLVVVVIAIAVEGLIATFKFLREDPQYLLQSACIVAGVGILLAGWGYFIRANRDAEELEPEAMEQAKREDRKLRK